MLLCHGDGVAWFRLYGIIEHLKFYVEGTRCSGIHNQVTRGLWLCHCIVSGGLLSDSLVFLPFKQ